MKCVALVPIIWILVCLTLFVCAQEVEVDETAASPSVSSDDDMLPPVPSSYPTQPTEEEAKIRKSSSSDIPDLPTVDEEEKHPKHLSIHLYNGGDFARIRDDPYAYVFFVYDTDSQQSRQYENMWDDIVAQIGSAVQCVKVASGSKGTEYENLFASTFSEGPKPALMILDGSRNARPRLLATIFESKNSWLKILRKELHLSARSEHAKRYLKMMRSSPETAEEEGHLLYQDPNEL